MFDSPLIYDVLCRHAWGHLTPLCIRLKYPEQVKIAENLVGCVRKVLSALVKILEKIEYRKFPKYSDTQKICCNHSKIWTMWLYHTVMSPNDADGMANSVDPDQTAPLGAVWSGSALFAQVYLSKNLGSLRYARNDYHKLTATGSTATITALKTRHCIREITGIPSPRAPTLYRPNITGPTYDKILLAG